MFLDRRFFEDVPKAQLHIHMDGALPVEDIWAISQKHGINLPKLPEQTREALEAYYRVDPDERFDTVERFVGVFLAKFGPTIALTKTPAGMREAATAHVRDLARQKHVYAETRFAPQYSVKKGFSLQDVIQEALLGLNAGYLETGTLVKLIISIGRECDQETSLAVAKAATEFQHNGVVALDLACSEEEFPPELHIGAYRIATEARLKRTVHAGEFPCDRDIRVKNMRTALTDLRANGLGHAIPLAGEDEILARVVRDGIRIESCPLSNLKTGTIKDIRELGLDKLLRAGVRVSLSTDDPLMFGTSMADVMQATCDAYGFGLEDVRTLTRNAVQSAFCNDEERTRLYYEFMRRGFPLFA
ncbi:adenosine deaminase [Candidatus Peregrinibacteria bacterium]|nr:adenosine deaminase [Candidatus Peregrinibacteria bacterium]